MDLLIDVVRGARSEEEISNKIKNHLSGFLRVGESNANSLYSDYIEFIEQALVGNRRSLLKCRKKDSAITSLSRHKFLISCLKKLYKHVPSVGLLLFEHWNFYISQCVYRGHYMTSRNEILGYLDSLDITVDDEKVLIPNYIGKPKFSIEVLDILMCYIESLFQNGSTQDAAVLNLAIQRIDQWLDIFDGDKYRRKWIVENLISIRFCDDDSTPKILAVTLLQYTKVSDTINLTGVLNILNSATFKNSRFLENVFTELARLCKVEGKNIQDTNRWAPYLMQLDSYARSRCLHPMIRMTMQNVVSDYYLNEIFCKKVTLFQPMLLINSARNARLEGNMDVCIANLDKAIEKLPKGDINDPGAANFLLAQSLCLRALCCYEKKPCTEHITEQIEEALVLFMTDDFCKFAAQHSYLVQYTSKILCYVFDILTTDHATESCHKLVKDMLLFFKDRLDVGMSMWPFKIHHTHLKSEIFHSMVESDTTAELSFASDCGRSTIDLESMVSSINNKAHLSTRLACFLAQVCYELSERMVSMGSMTKALRYVRESNVLGNGIINENFKVVNDRGGVYTMNLDPIVAAHVWSVGFEDSTAAPYSSYKCYLNGLHQEATILELTGDVNQALACLKRGKAVALMRGCSFFVGRFHAAIAKIDRKLQYFDEASQELTQAKECLIHICCEKCQLILKVDIIQESVKQIRTCIGFPNRQAAEDGDSFVSAENMLRTQLMSKPEDSKDGCSCWERSCRFSLLSVLTQKVKDHISKNKNREAHSVLMEIICMAVSLSSHDSSQSLATISEFIEFIQRGSSQVFYNTHIAHIIYLISWMAYKNDCTEFSISSISLISVMKLALVISSEIPELLKKVSQLLAIMYVHPHDKVPFLTPENSPTPVQWAAFCHQLTVGSEISFLFSYRLREVYGEPDPDDILHSITPSLDVDLDKFVMKFFEELKPHTLLVISILGNKYKNVLKRFMPSNCVASMMISRFKLTKEPLVGLYPIEFSGSGPRDKGTIIDKIAPEYIQIMKEFNSWEVLPDHNSLEAAHSLDERLSTFFSGVESLFGQHITSFLISEEDTSKGEPVILVLDKEIQMFPWECMHAFRNQEIYRMPSMSSIRYTYFVCRRNEKMNVTASASYATLDPLNAYYLITSADEQTSSLAKFFEKLHLKGRCTASGRCTTSDGEIIVERLKTCDLFIYVGHGDGLEHIPSDALKKVDMCSAVILMGCSSGLLELNGPYTPQGAPLDYLLAGSPIVIGNLRKIYSRWATRICWDLLKRCKERVSENDVVSIGSCLVSGRDVHKRPLSEGNTIIYGVPTFIVKRR